MDTQNLLKDLPLLNTLHAFLRDFESPCRIVACGLLSAGKSSLLNALSARSGKEYFAVGAGRTTSVCKDLSDGGVRWVDTPGLEGGDGDDEEAHRAIRFADILLFVHHPATGELHSAEVKFLREMAKCPETRHGLTERLCVVLTHRESHSELQLVRLERDIARQVASEIGANPEMFTVSSTVYLKGIRETKPKLKEFSRLHALRRRLADIAHRPDVVAHRRERLANISSALRRQIDQEIVDLEGQLKKKEDEIRDTEGDLAEDFTSFLRQLTKRLAGIDR